MLRPSLPEFVALARAHTVVPVWREVLADLETPVSMFLKLVGGGEGFLLESVEHGERWGRYSFVGGHPALTLVARGRSVEWIPEGDGGHAELTAGLPTGLGALGALEALLARFRGPRLPDLPPFHGGIVGWLGYDVVREIERLEDVPPDETGLPDAVMALTGHVAAFDHFRQRIYLVENVLVDSEAGEVDLEFAYQAAATRLEGLVEDLARPLPYQPVAPPSPSLEGAQLPDVRSSLSGDAYQDAVRAAREYILAGDIFQVVLAQRFDFDLEADPLDVYRVLRQVNPSPYMYFLRQPRLGLSIVGSSPEPMVQLLDGRVISRPIAGTRKRGRDEARDKRLAGELSEHPKERAEHVMLVDLARNDVGRVVRFGTETVDEMMTLERYSHVMHMTSQVSGELRPGQGPVDVLRATFPAGTVSGAPKVRAMEIIDELEPAKRGPDAGVVGYVDFSGNLDTAIAIRTMVVRETPAGPDGPATRRGSVSAGAGVVADSDPADEDLECHNKARAVLASVAAARHLGPRPEPTEAW